MKKVIIEIALNVLICIGDTTVSCLMAIVSIRSLIIQASIYKKVLAVGMLIISIVLLLSMCIVMYDRFRILYKDYKIYKN